MQAVDHFPEVQKSKKLSAPVDNPVGFLDFLFQPQAVDAAKATLRRICQGLRVLGPIRRVLVRV